MLLRVFVTHGTEWKSIWRSFKLQEPTQVAVTTLTDGFLSITKYNQYFFSPTAPDYLRRLA